MRLNNRSNANRLSGALSTKMADEETREFLAGIKQAIERSRGYADYFCWPQNRDLEELGILRTLCESLEKEGRLFLSSDSIRTRGRGNDPPDCEAEDLLGNLVGIEVTELVDSSAIEALKNSGVYEWAEWDSDKIVRAINGRLNAKDKPEQIKGGPYVSYVVVIHTDEPSLNATYVASLLKDIRFAKRKQVDRAFLLFSYDPAIRTYPHIELEFTL